MAAACANNNQTKYNTTTYQLTLLSDWQLLRHNWLLMSTASWQAAVNNQQYRYAASKAFQPDERRCRMRQAEQRKHGTVVLKGCAKLLPLTVMFYSRYVAYMHTRTYTCIYVHARIKCVFCTLSWPFHRKMLLGIVFNADSILHTIFANNTFLSRLSQQQVTCVHICMCPQLYIYMYVYIFPQCALGVVVNFLCDFMLLIQNKSE